MNEVFSSESIAKIRRNAAGRWLARFMCFGETVIAEERELGGERSPAVVVTGPEIGRELAASAIGCPVNLAARRGDGLLCHHWPNGPAASAIRGLDPLTHVGIIDSCWADAFGVVGSFLLLNSRVHDDLDRLDKSGLIACASLCLTHHVDFDITRPPMLMRVARVFSAYAISLSFTSVPLSLGSRVLRRLELD